MTPLVRRLRGAAGTALFWSIVWLPIGGALLWWRAMQPTDVVYGSPLVELSFFPAFGFVSGGVFAFILAWAERNSSLNELSLLRVAAWGAIGCLVIPIPLVVIDARQSIGSYDWTFPLIFLGVCAALGACCAALTLGLARRPLVR